MAVDTTLARALVTLLQAEQPFSKAATVVFTHDDYVDDVTTTRVRVGPGELNSTRVSRNHWDDQTILRITFEAAQQINTTDESATTQTDLDDWLTFVDEVRTHLKALLPSNKKATAIESDDRYDRDMLRNQNKFISTLLVTYAPQ